MSRTVLQVALVCLTLSAGLGCAAQTDLERAEEHIRSGDAYVAADDHQAAVLEYRNAVQLAPESGQARFKLGQSYLRVGNLRGALQELPRAADLLPEDAEVQLTAGTARLAAGQYEDARSRADHVLVRDASNVDAQILKGNAAAGLNDLDTAIGDLQQAIELAPDRDATYANLGFLQLLHGDEDEAESSFRLAVAAAPDSIDAHISLGRYFWATGRLSEAEESFTHAADLDADSVLVNRVFAAFLDSLGRSDEAERYLLALIEDPDDLQSHLSLASFYVGKGRSDEATATLRKIAERPEVFVEAQTRLAEIEYATGRHDSAHTIVDDILEREPNSHQPLALRSRWLLLEGSIDESIEAATKATTVAPEDALSQYMLGQALMAAERHSDAAQAFQEVLRLNPGAIPAQFELTRLHLARGDADAAVDLVTEVATRIPENPAVTVLMARALMAQGNADGAAEELEPVARAFPDLAEAHALMGTIRATRDDRTGARRSFERALEIDDRSEEALAGLVALDVAEGNSDVARRRVDAELASGRRDVSMLVLAARTYAADGDLDAAERSLEDATQDDPSNFEAYTLLARLHIARGDLEGATERYQSLADEAPSVGSFTMVGVLLTIQGRHEDSKQWYDRALALDSDAAVAANNLAYVLAEEGRDLSRALQLAQAAKAQLPDDANISDTLGWVYYRQDAPTLAIPFFRESVDGEPENALYRYHLGLAYLKADDKARARDALLQTLSIDPDFELAADVRRLLDGLGASQEQ